MKIFITGFLQVFFVAINTFFISKQFLVGSFVSACLINLIWTYNVKKVAFGENRERYIYALGAGIGSLSGLKVSILISQFIL